MISYNPYFEFIIQIELAKMNSGQPFPLALPEPSVAQKSAFRALTQRRSNPDPFQRMVNLLSEEQRSMLPTRNHLPPPSYLRRKVIDDPLLARMDRDLSKPPPAWISE